MAKSIDLRSDTVTTPTDRMRDAMRNAVVGDDVLGEDPTVSQLEEMGAALFGKEAGLFLVSGTMANQVAVLSLCSYGDQIVVHRDSHIYNLEVGGLATTCGVQPRAIDAPRGRYDLTALRKELHPSDLQKAPTTLICLENTHDLNRGLAVPGDHIAEVCDLAKQHDISVYLDGARIFNAAIALGATVAALSEQVDAVAVCLSKGLGCPIGSLLMGPESLIRKARRMRQRIGGGWRQAGILAAAGIVALEEMVERLAKDHLNARSLAEGLIELGLDVDLEQVQTNIIHVSLEPHDLDAPAFCQQLADLGVKAKMIGPQEVRMVTHKDIEGPDIGRVLEAVNSCIRSPEAMPSDTS
jgi:threonine aldolase